MISRICKVTFNCRLLRAASEQSFLNIRSHVRLFSATGRPWSAEERDRLLKLTSGNDSGENIDWFRIAQEHFPDRDPLELSFEWEFHRSSWSNQNSSAAPSVPASIKTKKIPNKSKRKSKTMENSLYSDAWRWLNQPLVRRWLQALIRRGQQEPPTADQIKQWMETGKKNGRTECIECLDIEKEEFMVELKSNWTKLRAMLLADWTPVELQKLYRLHLTGQDMTNKKYVEEHMKRPFKECIAQLGSILENIEGQSKRQSRALPILIRRQYKVVGPDWGLLGNLMDVKSLLVRNIVERAPNIWYETSTSRFIAPLSSGGLDQHQSGTRVKKWTSVDIVSLNQAVEKQLDYYVNQGCTGQDAEKHIDWNLISSILGRGPEHCQSKYVTLQRKGNVRTGKFSVDEDRALLTSWLKHRENFSQYELIAPRNVNAWKNRVAVLLVQILRSEGIGLELASSLGISDELVYERCKHEPLICRSVIRNLRGKADGEIRMKLQ